MAAKRMPFELATERLILREWHDGDRAPYAAMNADPEVRRFFAGCLSRDESDAQIEDFRARFRRDGFSFAALQVKGGGLVGFCGLNRTDYPPHVEPYVEIGWRLARDAWGNGYATEAARAVLDYGFGRLRLAEIVAPSVAGNQASRAVMERLGMHRDPTEDFDDPDEPDGSPLRPSVLYRLRREDWNR